MKRDDNQRAKAKRKQRPSETARAAFYDLLDGQCILRQVLIEDWKRMRKLMQRYPALRAELPRSYNGLRLVVDNRPKRPAGKVARYRTSQNDDGPEAA